MNVSKSCCCNFSYGFAYRKTWIELADLSTIDCFVFRICFFFIISKFVLVLLRYGKCSRFETTPEWCLLRNKVQSVWVSFTIFQRKWSIWWIILLKILPIVVYLWCSQNVVFFCNQNGIVTFCQSCLLVRFLVNTTTFLREMWFLISLVIVMLNPQSGWTRGTVTVIIRNSSFIKF